MLPSRPTLLNLAFLGVFTAGCARVLLSSYPIVVDGESYTVFEYEFVTSIPVGDTAEVYVRIDGEDYLCVVPPDPEWNCAGVVRLYRAAEAGRGSFPPTARERIVENALPPSEEASGAAVSPGDDSYTPPPPDTTPPPPDT